MEEMVIKLKDKHKRDFLLQLLEELDFVEVVKIKSSKKKGDKKGLSPEQQEFVEGLTEALEEVELHRQGKIKLPTLKEVLSEL